MTKLVHATNNEMGMVYGGQPGDQTEREVCIQDFFEYEWEYVFRPKRADLAEKAAMYAEIIAKNDAIGYAQDDRYTMYLRAKNNGWNFAAITNPVSTDCSQLVATILIACGLNVSPYMYTGNEKGCLQYTGEFVTLLYEKDMRLVRGDIILTTRKGHTAIVVEGTFPSALPKWVGECYGAEFVPVYAEASEKAKRCEWPTLGTGNLFDVCDETASWLYIRIAGVYYGWIRRQFCLRKTVERHGTVINGGVYVRSNAGATFEQIGVLKEHDTVSICDMKVGIDGNDWYYIKYGDGWGFCSGKYIREY